MRDERERLQDILEAIRRIEVYAVRGRAAFDADELIQSWILRHLQIIGEACAALPRGFRSVHPDVPWTKIIGMRNVLVHSYFSIDPDAVWAAVERDVPDLKARIERLLQLTSPRP